MNKLAEQKTLIKALKGPNKKEQELIVKYKHLLSELNYSADIINNFVKNINNDKRRNYLSKIRYINKLVRHSNKFHIPDNMKFSWNERRIMDTIRGYVEDHAELCKIYKKIPAFVEDVDCIDIHEFITQDKE